MTIDTSAARPPLTTLSDEETMFRDAVAGFAEEEVRPRVQQMEREGKIDPKLIAKFFEMGLMAVEVPESLGGADGSLMMVALAVEEISKIDPAAAILMDVQNTLVNYPIRTYGSDYIKSTYLAQLASEKVGAYALSEPASGSDAFGMQSRAEQRGDGWVLTGRKLWITNGAEAEIYVVFANANPSAGYKGITAFVVERGYAGFGVGKKEDKLGIRASSTTELILDGVQVPNENVLGPVGQGYKIAIDTLNGGRVGIGAQMIGVAQGALRAALDFVTERRQFGKAIADFQAVQFQLAQARAELEGARLLVPTESTALRRSLSHWLDAQGIRPAIVAEFQDSALLVEFGCTGDGAFPAPSMLEDVLRKRYGVESAGRLPDVQERFYAISVERRLRHPAVVAITEAARTELFS